MDTLFNDLRYGFRSLLKQPAFTLVAFGTLALAIGGNRAMFTVVNAVLLRPLSYHEPDRIVTLEGINPPRGITQSNMSIPDFADWQSQNQVFEQMAGFVTGGVVLNNGEEAERVRGAGVSADFFSLFRATALRGRTLQPDSVVGVATGLGGALLLTRWMTSLLFGVKPTDWLTLLAVSVGVLVTALLACYLPARRATKVDPLVALRCE